MINNNNLPIALYTTLNLSTNSENNNQNNVTIDNYIEIPENITNFKQLLCCESFTEIKQQYIKYINQLANLYNYFTETHTDDIAQLNKDKIINSSINNLRFYEQNKNHSNYETLFYSYNNIRKFLYNIINYLVKYKNEAVINNETSIICSELKECLDICLEGFNGKIIIINDYIEYISSNELDYKIKCKLKNLIQNKIREAIIAKRKVINIHSQTAFFNLVAADYNFDLIVDSYASLYDFEIHEAYKIIKKIKNSMSQFDVYTEIVNELYNLFKELLIKINKAHWLNNNNIEDFTQEDTDILRNFFIHPLNKYLTITDTQEQLSIRDIICEQLTSYSIHLADIKDVLHFFIAKNLNKFANVISNFKEITNVIAVIESNLAIINVNNCYFYILKDNQEKLPLQLQHIQNSNIFKTNETIYTAIFMQALEQTKSIEDIYKFLNSTNINKLLFNNKNLIVELNNSTKYNKHLKKKITSAILYTQINYNNTINYNLCMKCIEKNILTIDILNNLLERRIDVVFYFFSLLTLNNLYGYISSLNYNNIKKVIKQLKYHKVNFYLQEAFYLLFKNHKWELLELILTSEVKFTFFDYLSKSRQLTVLKILLDSNKKNISKYFLLDYITLGIKDNNKNNILHVIVNNNDEELLLKITKQIPSYLLNILMLSKNNYGFTVLMSAVEKNNINLVKILMPFCNLQILGAQSKKGMNALMLAIKNKNLLCFQKLAKTATTKILTAVNEDDDNILMLAIYKKCDDIVNDIIERLNDENMDIFKQYCYYYGDNSLGLAIIHKSSHLVKIIDKSNTSISMHCNKHGYNSFMLAATHGITDEALLLLLQKYKLSAIYKQTIIGNNALMLAAMHGNINMVKFLLKYYDNEQMLNIKNHTGDTAMMMASQKGNLLCLQELLNKATVLNLLECNVNGHNSLILATICNKSNCIIPIIEKYEKLIPTNKINYDIWYAIQLALKNGRLLCLQKLLIKANTTILTMSTTYNYNNLMIAVNNNSYKGMSAILNKANTNEKEKMLNQQDKINGNTAIMIATAKGYDACLVDLLQVSTPEMLTKTNNRGYNILMLAVNKKNTKCMQVIIEKSDSEVLTDILKQKSNKNGSNAIMIASRIGATECLSLLLEQLTDKTVDILLETDKVGKSALNRAIFHYNINCVSILVNKIEKCKNLIKYEHIYEHAIRLASEKNHLECLTLLLQYSTTKILAATDDQDYNSLMIATSENNYKALPKILEKSNSDILLQKSKKYADTAITIAAKNGYVSCLNLLLEKATLEALAITNIDDNDCLMLAFINHHYDCVQMIIDKLNVITFRQNNSGNNAIMLAAINGVVQILQRLLASSITTEVLATINHEGDNCLMLAIKYKHHQCTLDILEKANYDMLQQKNNNGYNALNLAKKYHNHYYDRIVAKKNYFIELNKKEVNSIY
jgi:ankyrin repeat protein